MLLVEDSLRIINWIISVILSQPPVESFLSSEMAGFRLDWSDEFFIFYSAPAKDSNKSLFAVDVGPSVSWNACKVVV